MLARRCTSYVLCIAISTFAIGTLASCGSGSNTGVVASVGNSTITRAAVNHWMLTMAGEDYYAMSHGHTVPFGLVSDPPQYPLCISRLEEVAAHSPAKPTVPGSRLLAKCHELHHALKVQAVTFLLGAARSIQIAHELGIAVSHAEVVKLARQRDAALFPNEAAHRTSLAMHHTTYADELLNTEVALISQKLFAKVRASRDYGSLLTLEKRWIAKTNCRSDYIVETCKQYATQPAAAPQSLSASVLMEQVAALATGLCINLPACAKQ